jgi:hypothetical protein
MWQNSWVMWQNAGKSGLDQWDVFSGGLAPDGTARTHDPLVRHCTFAPLLSCVICACFQLLKL